LISTPSSVNLPAKCPYGVASYLSNISTSSVSLPGNLLEFFVRHNPAGELNRPASASVRDFCAAEVEQ
jgi:hypothetical protein